MSDAEFEILRGIEGAASRMIADARLGPTALQILRRLMAGNMMGLEIQAEFPGCERALQELVDGGFIEPVALQKH